MGKSHVAASAQSSSVATMRTDDGLRQETGALQRGLALLELMVQAGRPLTLTELAKSTGLHTSTIHRLLQTLMQSEHVFRDAGRRYYAGPKAYLPLSLYHPFNLLRRDAYDTMRDLRDRYSVTCALNLFVGTQRLVLEMATANDSLSPYYQTHLTSPLHAAASGKVLLLGLPAESRDELLGSPPYERYTPHTIVERETLVRELQHVAELGYASTRDENFDGISAVSAPIVPAGERTVGALTLAGPSRYFADGTIEAMGRDTVRAAKLLAFGSPGVKAVVRMFGF